MRTNQSFAEQRASFRWSVPEHFNLGVAMADRHRDERPALYYEHANGATHVLSAAALSEGSNRFANALRALGVAIGDRVAVVLPQRPETIIAHAAIYKLGAICLPLSILFRRDALEYRLRDSGARVVIADGTHLDLIRELAPDLPELKAVIQCGASVGTGEFWTRLEKGASALDPVTTRSDDPAVLIYTSGTTGPPKGALNAHRWLLGNLPSFDLSYNFFPETDDVMWTPADWAWTGGLMDALVPALYYGVPMVGYEGGRFDPEKALYLMERYGIRNGFLPPTAIKMLMQVANPERYRLNLRSICSAGEQVGAEVINWAEERLRVVVNEMYGQTEFNYLVGQCRAVMPLRPGSMGQPYPCRDVDVIDEEGHVLPVGEVGELAARGDDPIRFLGYWQRPEATQAKFVGEWWTTGDLGYRDDDGYLWFMGRKDDVISSAGYRIGPGEIEDCLLKHPAVAQAAVIGVSDALRGQIVKAFIVLAQGNPPSDALADAIRNSVRDQLAAYEYPRAVEFIDELPMTTTGKVRRIELRQREEARDSK